MEDLFTQFTRVRQFIRNVSPRTLKAYQWKAFAPKKEQKVLATMTPEHASRLVAYRAVTWADKRIQMLACLILDTGLRIDEALS